MRCGEEYLSSQSESGESECGDFLMNGNTIWMEIGRTPPSSALTD